MRTSPTERDPRTYAVIGAAMEVHRVLRPGFPERVYAQALAIEMQMRGIRFLTQMPFAVVYKEHTLGSDYRVDFVCFESVVVELKAISARVGGIEEAQMINYLRASDLQHGLVLNFGTASLEYRRFIWSPTNAVADEVLEQREP